MCECVAISLLNSNFIEQSEISTMLMAVQMYSYFGSMSIMLKYGHDLESV
jgi:hypothetical protein